MPLKKKTSKTVYKKLDQLNITPDILLGLEIVLEDKPDAQQNQRKQFWTFRCDENCTKCNWSFKELEDLGVNINNKKDFKEFQLNHYKTCKTLKKQLADPYSWYSKKWLQFETQKIDLTLTGRTCKDCGKVFRNKDLRKQHTKHYRYEDRENYEFGKGCKYHYDNLVELDCYYTMTDDIDCISGLGSLDESIKLYMTIADKRKLMNHRKKFMVAYEYDTLIGAETLVTRHIVSLYDARISEHIKHQFKIMPLDFQDGHQSDKLCNWVISDTENERLRDEGAYYVDGCWSFSND
jgi:hypothetical protein